MVLAQYIRLLRENPNFKLLWSAQVISLLGDWFNTIVLSTLVVQYSDGSGLAVSLFLMVRFLPPLLVGPFAGVLVDRFDRKRILVYSNVLRTVVVLGFLLATTPDTLWLIYVLTILQFTLSALFEPGQSAIMPSLVARGDLVIANTLTSITWSVMLALGAIAGGVVAAVFGSATALVIDALTFALAGYLISRIQYNEASVIAETSDMQTPEPDESGNFMDGIRYLMANPSIASILLVKGGGSIGNVDTLMTIFATQIFILGTNGQLSLGIMYSAFGVGAILGPLLLNVVNDGTVRRMRRLVILGFLFALIGWLFIGAGWSLFIVSMGLLVRAMGGSVNWTYSSVIIQKSVPDRFLGRVFALDMAVFQLATVLSILLHGGLVDLMGADQIPLISYGTAVVSLIPLLVWIFMLPKMEKREAVIPAVGD